MPHHHHHHYHFPRKINLLIKVQVLSQGNSNLPFQGTLSQCPKKKTLSSILSQIRQFVPYQCHLITIDGSYPVGNVPLADLLSAVFVGTLLLERRLVSESATSDVNITFNIGYPSQ